MTTRYRSGLTLVAAAVSMALLASCATTETRSSETAGLRDKLTRLQSDPQLASRAPVALKDAETALQAAELPERDTQRAAHLRFIADRKIDTAEALARERLAVDQRTQLADARDAMRLQARTQEAAAANSRARVAQADAQDQRREATAANDRTAVALASAEEARVASEAARASTAAAQADALELQRQVDLLNAKVTERGLVITLGDVLFETGKSTLRPNGDAHLDKLAGFLVKYPDRTMRIEGYTDSVGSDDYNLALSQHRADAVKSYLVNKGIDTMRVTTAGMGESSPVGDNQSSTGRQQNRRVEVILADATPLTR